MADQIAPALIGAARAICRTLGVDPDAATSSAYGAPQCWETYLPHAQAAGASFAGALRAVAEVARAAAMVSKDQIEAERLNARADALYEAAALIHPKAGANVVAFRQKDE